MTEKTTETPNEVQVAAQHLSNANLGILHEQGFGIWATHISGALIFRREPQAASNGHTSPEPQQAARKTEEPAPPVVNGEVLTDNVAAVRNLS